MALEDGRLSIPIEKTAATIVEKFELLVAAGKAILMVILYDELAARVPRTITLADGLIVDGVVR